MKTVAVYEAKNRFSKLLAEVALGEEFTITRHHPAWHGGRTFNGHGRAERLRGRAG